MAKVAIVTGGTRGIGAAIARSLKDSGHTVAAVYAGNDAAAAKFRAENDIAVYKWDVGDIDASAAGVKQVEARARPGRGAGQQCRHHTRCPVPSDELGEWSAVMRTNLDSMFAMTRPVIEGMRARNAGRIICISSINGQKGQLGQANYAASKAGIIGFTKALALESARKGITVNAICPGYIDTDMVAGVSEKVLEEIVRQIPVGRLGKAQEIASLVAYLASDDAAFISGAVFSANGGQYIANG